MHAHVNPNTLYYARRLLLIATLQAAAPIAGAGTLVTQDILGAARTTPATMGALENDTSLAAIPAPTGLAVQRM